MPIVSEAQRKAMGAAMSGHSNLGIPKSVGKEFIEATPKGKHLPARADAAIDCSEHVHNYLGAVVRGDSAGMKNHAKKFHRG